MIEINLLPGRKDFGLGSVAGQIGVINFKFLIIALVIHFFVRPAFETKWQSSLNDENILLEQTRKELEIVKKKSREYAQVREEVEAMAETEKKLSETLDVVKNIFKEKKNPMSMLLYIARNIPDDVWLIKLNFEKDKITIIGESKSYKSIGKFIDNLQNSIFFGKKVKLDDSRTVTNEKSGKRTEEFTLSSEIERYN